MEAHTGLKVRGKDILVTGGMTREVFEGGWLYANEARPEDHGHRVAVALEALGAQVTLVSAQTKLACPRGIDVVSVTEEEGPIVSAQDMAEACSSLCKETVFDAYVALAVEPSLVPVSPSEPSLDADGAKSEVPALSVKANVDLLALQGEGFPRARAGYSARQEFGSLGLLAQTWRGLIDAGLHADRVVTSRVRPPMPAGSRDLEGQKLIVSSGPVVERLTATGDILTNFSSGVQGHEIACALADRGADVVLVSGPVGLSDPTHANIRTLHVRSAKEMLDVCMGELPARAFIAASAGLDFCSARSFKPLTGADGVAQIELVHNSNLLQGMGRHVSLRPNVVVGVETEAPKVVRYARGALQKQGVDAVFADLASAESDDTEKHRAFYLTANGITDCGAADKYHVGLAIADYLADAALRPSLSQEGLSPRQARLT